MAERYRPSGVGMTAFYNAVRGWYRSGHASIAHRAADQEIAEMVRAWLRGMTEKQVREIRNVGRKSAAELMVWAHAATENEVRDGWREHADMVSLA